MGVRLGFSSLLRNWINCFFVAGNNQRKADVFCLMGPTASGKTNLAVELVKQYPFEIINVDSVQIYRGMDIGTGKPSKATLKAAPHRLLDIRDPAELYSAADFQIDAIREIFAIIKSGKVPLLVGGTMLYFRVLRDGLADLPSANQKVRRGIEIMARNHGWERVHSQLALVDPEAAARIHPKDPQRLQRALEVFLVSGKRLTEFFTEEAEKRLYGQKKQPFNFHFFGIQPPDRTVLHNDISKRFTEMLADGFISEVETLYKRGDLTNRLPSMKSVGYRQIWQFLSGELDYQEMVDKSTVATRQLAKRQCTWLRSWPSLNTLIDDGLQSRDKVLNYCQSISI